MTRKLNLTLAACLLVVCAGCAANDAAPPPKAVVGMSLDEAKQIVVAFEDSQGKRNAAEPLRNPGSLDDVVEILKRDQVDLFGAGVTFASTQEGAKARALHAQIELAWGGAQAVLADVFWDLGGRLSTTERRLQLKAASGALDADDQTRLASLQDTIGEATKTAEALTRVAAEHVAAGATLARQVIEQAPDDYQGYRVAADYYRLRDDWTKFDEMIAKIESTNPDSNGLVFLRGVAAELRDDANGDAAALFRQALEKDPQFTRAQAHLLLTQKTIDGTYEEYKKLKALNPNHQIVVWAGPAIEKAYQEWIKKRQGKVGTHGPAT